MSCGLLTYSRGVQADRWRWKYELRWLLRLRRQVTARQCEGVQLSPVLAALVFASLCDNGEDALRRVGVNEGGIFIAGLCVPTH